MCFFSHILVKFHTNMESNRYYHSYFNDEPSQEYMTEAAGARPLSAGRKPRSRFCWVKKGPRSLLSTANSEGDWRCRLQRFYCTCHIPATFMTRCR